MLQDSSTNQVIRVNHPANIEPIDRDTLRKSKVACWKTSHFDDSPKPPWNVVKLVKLRKTVDVKLPVQSYAATKKITQNKAQESRIGTLGMKRLTADCNPQKDVEKES